MKLSEAEIGRKVIYTPFVGCDPKDREEGTITSKNSLYVFVRYGEYENSTATEPSDIEYI